MPPLWPPHWALEHSVGLVNHFPFTGMNLLFWRICKKRFGEGGMRGLEDYSEKNLGLIPLGMNVEVRNPFKLTAFLAGLRAWIEQTAPNDGLEQSFA